MGSKCNMKILKMQMSLSYKESINHVVFSL